MGTAPQGHLSSSGCFYLVLYTLPTQIKAWASMGHLPAEQLCSLALHPQDTETGECYLLIK